MKRNGQHKGSGFLGRGAWVAAWLAGWWVAPGGAAFDGRVKIYQDMLPLVITNAGSYVAVENLTVSFTRTNAIEVRASHVTIDLGGFTLQGPGASSGCGIYQGATQINLCVRNGTVEGWAGSNGIHVAGASFLVEGVTLRDNNSGLFAVQNGIVAECLAVSNTYSGAGLGGHGIYCGQGTVVTECRASRNNVGLDGALGNAYLKCVAWDNRSQGFAGWKYSLAADCVARANGAEGFRLQDGLIEHCVAAGSRYGFYMPAAGLTAGSAATECGVWGFYGDTLSDPQLMVNNVAAFNTNGFFLGQGSLIAACLVYTNQKKGVQLGYARVDECLAAANGIGLLADANTRMDNNTVCDNVTGIQWTGRSNIVVRNVLSGNVTNWSTVPGSLTGWTTHTTNKWPWINYVY